jgi:hypothetical protein
LPWFLLARIIYLPTGISKYKAEEELCALNSLVLHFTNMGKIKKEDFCLLLTNGNDDS